MKTKSSWLICGRKSWSWMTPANQRWSQIPGGNASRVERVLVALDMAETLYKRCLSSGFSSWWMEWIWWQIDQVWHHTEHHECPCPESSLLKAFELKVVEHKCYRAFLSIVSSDEPCGSALKSLYCVNVSFVGIIPNGWGILQLWTN